MQKRKVTKNQRKCFNKRNFMCQYSLHGGHTQEVMIGGTLYMGKPARYHQVKDPTTGIVVSTSKSPGIPFVRVHPKQR